MALAFFAGPIGHSPSGKARSGSSIHPASNGSMDRSCGGGLSIREIATMSALSMATLASAHHQFEAALPAIHRSARYLLRHRRRDRDELLAELTACCWKAW